MKRAALLFTTAFVAVAALLWSGTMARAAGVVELRPGGTSVPLTLPPASAAKSRMFVTLRGVTADVAPGVLYRLYLDPPGGKADPAHYIGDINFYDVGAVARADRFSSFDVTALLAKLGGKPDARHTLLIVPLGTPAPGAAPRIAQIRMVAE